MRNNAQLVICFGLCALLWACANVGDKGADGGIHDFLDEDVGVGRTGRMGGGEPRPGRGDSRVDRNVYHRDGRRRADGDPAHGARHSRIWDPGRRMGARTPRPPTVRGNRHHRRYQRLAGLSRRQAAGRAGYLRRSPAASMPGSRASRGSTTAFACSGKTRSRGSCCGRTSRESWAEASRKARTYDFWTWDAAAGTASSYSSASMTAGPGFQSTTQRLWSLPCLSAIRGLILTRGCWSKRGLPTAADKI